KSPPSRRNSAGAGRCPLPTDTRRVPRRQRRGFCHPSSRRGRGRCGRARSACCRAGPARRREGVLRAIAPRRAAAPAEPQPCGPKLAALFESSIQSTQRPAELAGCLLARLAVEVTAQDRLAATLRQPRHFFVERFSKISLVRSRGPVSFAGAAFVKAPACLA